VNLYKKIVFDDENYKDAPHLLAQAIDLRLSVQKRTPLPRPAILRNKKAIWAASGGLAIFVFAVIGGFFWFEGDSMLALESDTTANTPAASINSTAPPTAMAPLEPDKFSVAYALTQIGKPYFETSFDSWGSLAQTPNTDLKGGKLIVSSVNDEHAGVQVSELQADRYAVAFEVRMMTASPEGQCIYEATTDGDDSVRRALSVKVFPAGSSSLSHWVFPEGNLDIPDASGRIDVTVTNSILVTIIEDEIAVYINGRPAYMARDTVGSAVYTGHSLSANYTAECEFDNFKIWDLSGVDFFSVIQSLPYWLQLETPVYQIGFDSWSSSPLTENAKIENGKLIESSLDQKGVSVHLADFSSDKFAIEFEVDILDSASASSCVLELSNQFETEEAKKAVSVEFWSDASAIISRYIYRLNGHEPFDMGTFDKNKTNTITLIVLKEQIVVLINNNLAFTSIDPGWNAVYNKMNLSAYGLITCEYDYVKLWELNDIDLSGIARPVPTPTTDFQVLNSENGHYYRYYFRKLSWNDARDYCASQGGYLVTIQDRAEDDFVYQLTSGNTFLGASDMEEEGTWVWVSGEPWEFTNWDNGEPNNSEGDEDYLSYHYDANDSRWNDQGNGPLFFTCEWEP
ncbi:MAG: hypothetical protein L6Q49_16285, partial [Anaerolineales bacterium]|nr:hypothetical protein [Anaerolineales bacterium]